MVLVTLKRVFRVVEADCNQLWFEDIAVEHVLCIRACISFEQANRTKTMLSIDDKGHGICGWSIRGVKTFQHKICLLQVNYEK